MNWNFFRQKQENPDKVRPDDAFEKKHDSATDVKNKKFEQLGLFELIKTLPWHANGIYLEDNKKHVKAVCSSEDISRVLANCVDHYSSFPGKDVSKMVLYKDFIQDAYYLYIAMSKAKIPVNNLETAFVEKAFHQFCQSFGKLLEVEHIRLESADDNLPLSK